MKPSEIFEGENSSLKKAFDMTNNNWIEQIELCLQSENPREQINRYIQSLLTKKDQEHKAELESIKGEITPGIVIYSGEDGYRAGYNQALEDALAILDRHINSLTTE